MDARERSPERPDGDLLRSRNPYAEMERAVDVDLFLEAQKQWAKDSPYCLVICLKCSYMQSHKGRRRWSRLSARDVDSICPSWDPEVGTPAIQLVHLDIEREQLLDLYL